MSILKIIKLESGAFLHNDSIDGDFFLGKFYFKQERNKAFIVESYGAKRRTYLVSEIKVFDFGGTEESFTNWTVLFNRLTTLGYNGIETNGLIPANIETTANKTDAIVGNETSSIKYPSVKGLVDWVTSLFVPKTRTLTIGAQTFDLSANRTFTLSGGADHFLMEMFFNVGTYTATAFELMPSRDAGASIFTMTNDFYPDLGVFGDGRGASKILPCDAKLKGVFFRYNGLTQNLRVRIFAYDINTGTPTNLTTLALKTVPANNSSGGLFVEFSPSEILNITTQPKGRAINISIGTPNGTTTIQSNTTALLFEKV